MEFGSGGIQVEGLQYVGRLVVRGWFLKWNCFFIVWVRWLANFRTRWCVEARGVGTKSRSIASTSVSMGDSWWKEISYGFIPEACLEFLEDPTLGASESFRCACFLEEFLG